MAKYVFDNAGGQTLSRFSALESLFDAGTFRRISELGIAHGWRCLEVGGGSGSVARWLSSKVGPEGKVVVTDIDPRHLASFDEANVEVRQHDIVNDEIEQGLYDFAHTRLVLLHIPERERAVARIVESLRPGGWALFEEFDSLSMKPDPSVNSAEDLLKSLVAMWELMTEQGVELRFGRLLPRILEANGLQNVAAEGRVSLWRGGSGPAAELMRANFLQMHDRLIESGRVTEEEFQADIARLDDPHLQWPSSVLWAVRGQRPSR